MNLSFRSLMRATSSCLKAFLLAGLFGLASLLAAGCASRPPVSQPPSPSSPEPTGALPHPDTPSPACPDEDASNTAMPPSSRASAQPATRPMRIMLDPGHGGEDSGALSSCGRFRESAHVLDIARRLSSHLTLAGYEVRLTRQDDITAVPLAERTAMAAVWESDLLVSLHLNSASSGAARGIETYVLPPVGMRSTVQNHVAELSPAALAMMIREFSGNQHDEENHRLAQKIQHRMVATTPLPDRGVRFARYAVLRNASMPAVLVEAGFLSNRQDAAFLATPEGRENIALGIFRGIAEYAADRADAVPSSGSRVEGDAPVPGIPGAEGVFRERGET